MTLSGAEGKREREINSVLWQFGVDYEMMSKWTVTGTLREKISTILRLEIASKLGNWQEFSLKSFPQCSVR